MTMDFSPFKKATEDIHEWLRKEYANIRTSEASPSVLDGVNVFAYGSKTPINQVATINVEGPKSLRITPWDKSVAKNIDEAIRLANLGLSVSLDSEGVRVSFPELTSERRTLLIKTAKEKLEDARIRLRNEREKMHDKIEKMEKDGDIGKDEKFRLRDNLQKLVDEANKSLEEVFERKEKEIER